MGNSFQEASKEWLKDPRVPVSDEEAEAYVQIGDLLRKARESRGLSQTQLQSQSGIQQADISRIESGSMRRGPTVATLVRLAHAQNLRLKISFVEVEPTAERPTETPTQTTEGTSEISVVL